MPADTPLSNPQPLLILEGPEWLDASLTSPSRTPEDLPGSEVLDRIWSAGLSNRSLATFFNSVLPDLASELGTPWLAVLSRTPDWTLLGEFGRRPLPGWPQTLFDSVVDRQLPAQARVRAADLSFAVVVVPLPPASPDAAPRVLVGATRGSLARGLPAWHSVARPLSFGLHAAQQAEAADQQARSAQLALKTVTLLDSGLDRDSLLERFLAALGEWLGPTATSVSFWSRTDGELWRYAWPNPPLFPHRVPAVDQPWIEAWKQGLPFRREPLPASGPLGGEATATQSPSGWWLAWPLVAPTGERLAMFDVQWPPTATVDPSTSELLAEVAGALARTLAAEQERRELRRHQQQLTDQFARHVQLVGESPPMASLRGTVDQLATTDLAVLLLGERGTGREMVAKALHYQGRRRHRPFVAVNCAGGDPAELLLELFGREAETEGESPLSGTAAGPPGTGTGGAATMGQCELADGGTLFVDEIADLGPEGQAGLLKLMDDRQVTRVGGTQGLRVDVRVVAGSSVPLAELVKGGRLREDLALRLGVVSVDLPPLRDRPADVLPLAEFFLARFARQMGRPGLVLSAAARDRLTAHAWPGNVRELRNLMERVACLATTPEVRPEDLSFAISPERDSTLDAGEPGLAEATSQFQAGYIRRTIARVGGNMSEAARLLELHRSNLYRKMRQLGMEAPRGDGDGGE